MNDRHAASEAPKHLAELQPDVAAAKDQEVFRQLLQLHDRRVGQGLDLIQPLEAGNVGPGARVDEDPLGLQHLATNLDLMRPHKPGVTAIEAHSPAPLDPALLPAAELLHNVVFSLDDPGEIDAYSSSPDPPSLRVP